MSVKSASKEIRATEKRSVACIACACMHFVSIVEISNMKTVAELNKAYWSTHKKNSSTYLFICKHHDVFICHKCFEGVDAYKERTTLKMSQSKDSLT